MEYNTIASSFGCLSDKVHQMHSYVIGKYGDSLPYNYGVEHSQTSEQYQKYLKADDSMSGLPIH